MKTLTVEEASRDFSKLVAAVEGSSEEVVLLRNHRPVARLVPEERGMTADEMFRDIVGTLDEETGTQLQRILDEMRSSPNGRLDEIRNPWAG